MDRSDNPEVFEVGGARDRGGKRSDAASIPEVSGNAAALEEFLRKRAKSELVGSGRSLDEFSARGEIELERLRGILDGSAEGITLREVAGILFAFDFPLAALAPL